MAPHVHHRAHPSHIRTAPLDIIIMICFTDIYDDFVLYGSFGAGNGAGVLLAGGRAVILAGAHALSHRLRGHATARGVPRLPPPGACVHKMQDVGLTSGGDPIPARGDPFPCNAVPVCMRTPADLSREGYLDREDRSPRKVKDRCATPICSVNPSK
eukprot:5007055-Pyramimonas_sp.AAC.2